MSETMHVYSKISEEAQQKIQQQFHVVSELIKKLGSDLPALTDRQIARLPSQKGLTVDCFDFDPEEDPDDVNERIHSSLERCGRNQGEESIFEFCGQKEAEVGVGLVNFNINVLTLG